ncbi:MAG TPA: DNA alkylation repair protein [Paludibacter sp.]|nr:DNA alkylation repair protein [Paludibacter sp.]
MELFLSNDNIERQIKDIKQNIVLSMNGIVSEQMNKSGIFYKKNYGVSIPRILEISKLYKPDHNIAERLWAMRIRETMMLALLIEPIENFAYRLAKKRIGEIEQLDLAEFSSMYFFSKLPYSNELCLECVFSDHVWTQITGFMIGARIKDILNEKEIISLIDRAMDLSTTTEYQLHKSISTCLSRLCRIDKHIAQIISVKIKNFKTAESAGQQYIHETVTQEINFLNPI